MNNKYLIEFKELNIVSSGAFGCVFKVFRIECGSIFAIKKIPVNSDSAEEEKEANFLKELKSLFVVEYYAHWIDKNYYSPNYFNENLLLIGSGSGIQLTDPHVNNLLHIQMQLCVMSLKEVIVKLGNCLERNSNKSKRLTMSGYFIACELFIQLVKGVHFLQKRNVIHLDLKPENILIAFEDKSHFVKIADFGNAITDDCRETDRLLPKLVGTKHYQAPEVEYGRYERSSDLFSVGVIAENLFYINIEDETDFYSDIENIVLLIKKLQSIDTDSRGSCEEILAMHERESLITLNNNDISLLAFLNDIQI